MELVKLEKLINEVTEQFPLHSQDGKGLDTFVSFKLQYANRRNNPEGYWYVTEATRDGDDVQFAGLARVAGLVGEKVAPALFRLSDLMRLIGQGHEIEIDTNFKPGPVRELYDEEKPLQFFIRTEQEAERCTLIRASRDEVCEMISGYFSPLDAEMGEVAHKIGEALADEVCNCMINNASLEQKPALLRVIGYRLGLVSARQVQGF